MAEGFYFTPSSPLASLSQKIDLTVGYRLSVYSDCVKVTMSSQTLSSNGVTYTSTETTTYTIEDPSETYSLTNVGVLQPTWAGISAGSGSVNIRITLTQYDENDEVIIRQTPAYTYRVTSISCPNHTTGLSSLERCNASGIDDDGGLYGRIEMSIANFFGSSSPTLTVDTTSTSTTWYSSYNALTGVSNPITDWTTIHTATIYGVFSATTSSTHTIECTSTNTASYSVTVTGSLPKGNFYPLNFVAGGNGVGFGVKGETDKLKCGLNAVFSGTLKRQVTESGSTVLKDVSIEGHTHTVSEITDLTSLYSLIYPIGSIVEVGCSSSGLPIYSPSTAFGGTWSEYKMKSRDITIEETSLATTSDYWTRNTTNCTNARILCNVFDNVMGITIYFTNKVVIADTTLVFLTLNLQNILGILTLPNEYMGVGYSDDGEAIIQMKLETSGEVESLDYVSKASATTTSHKHSTVAASNLCRVSFTVPLSVVGSAFCGSRQYIRTA